MHEQKKVPPNNWKDIVEQNNYPRGRRQQVMNKMTAIDPSAQKEFQKSQCWKDVYNFHKKNTPWLTDTQINDLIKIYKMEAQTANQKNLLKTEDKWRLDDC